MAPIQAIIQTLRPTPAIAPAPDAAMAADRAALARLGVPGAPILLGANQELFAQDDPVRHCYQVISGCLCTERVMEDGRRLVGGFLMPGALLGFEARDLHDDAAQAVCPSTLYRYPYAAVANLAANDPGFGQFLWRHASAALRREHDHMLLLGRKTALERVASFLRDMTIRGGCDAAGWVALPMGRADIADHLGLTVETVSRTMTQLRRDGVIDILPGKIILRDRRALADAACEPMPRAAILAHTRAA